MNKLKVTLFYRHPKTGFSIEHVFKTLSKEYSQNIQIEEVFVPRKRSMPWDILLNSLFVFSKRGKINHITGHIHDVSLALIGIPTVLTIHDLVFIDNVKNPIKRLYKWLFWLYFPSMICKHIVCISSETKRNVLRHVNKANISVIMNPIDPAFHFKPKEFNNIKPVILHIGTGWNKNLNRTILALNGISCHLRIVGKLKPEYVNLLNEMDLEYSNVSNLSDQQIINEYINCDIVNFPSEYEGFGMPIIEGQRIGRVVVTSRIEPLIEVSGDAVEYVDPFDLNSIRAAYLTLINNSARRSELIRSGLKNSNRFDVKVIANQYLSIYKKINENS